MRLFIVLGALLSASAFAKNEVVLNSYVKAAKKVGVPADLLRAICYAESTHNSKAFVFRDGGHLNHAIGACQVTVDTAYSMGFKDERCREDFTKRTEERTYEHCKLFGPDTNAYYAALYLKDQLNRYNGSWINAIAAYNAGSVRLCKTGWVRNKEGKNLYRCEKGGLLNQRYVDRVLKALKEGL